MLTRQFDWCKNDIGYQSSKYDIKSDFNFAVITHSGQNLLRERIGWLFKIFEA